MLQDSFNSIARQHRTEIKIERSRFIASVCPVADTEDATRFISVVSKKFHDATHSCFAYRCGLGTTRVFKYSDDGEPSGTAGRQILDALDRHQLTDTCIVVTRYFGGIKLGTGGLSRAYREAALKVMDEAGIILRYLTVSMRVVFPLSFTNSVLRILSSDSCQMKDSEYSDKGSISFVVRLSQTDNIKSSLVSATNGRATIQEMQ